MVIPPRLTPRAGPNVWTGDTMLPAHWMLPVGGGAAGELLAAVAALGGARPERSEHAPLPRFGSVLRDAGGRVGRGAGRARRRGGAGGAPSGRSTRPCRGSARCCGTRRTDWSTAPDSRCCAGWPPIVSRRRPPRRRGRGRPGAPAPARPAAARRLERGAGSALLRGWAADRFTAETAAAALLAVAAHLGAALPQD